MAGFTCSIIGLFIKLSGSEINWCSAWESNLSERNYKSLRGVASQGNICCILSLLVYQTFSSDLCQQSPWPLQSCLSGFWGKCRVMLDAVKWCLGILNSAKTMLSPAWPQRVLKTKPGLLWHFFLWKFWKEEKVTSWVTSVKLWDGHPKCMTLSEFPDRLSDIGHPLTSHFVSQDYLGRLLWVG